MPPGCCVCEQPCSVHFSAGTIVLQVICLFAPSSNRSLLRSVRPWLKLHKPNHVSSGLSIAEGHSWGVAASFASFPRPSCTRWVAPPPLGPGPTSMGGLHECPGADNPHLTRLFSQPRSGASPCGDLCVTMFPLYFSARPHQSSQSLLFNTLCANT